MLAAVCGQIRVTLYRQLTNSNEMLPREKPRSESIRALQSERSCLLILWQIIVKSATSGELSKINLIKGAKF